MTAHTVPQLVDADDLPEYPFGKAHRLPGHFFIPLEFDRFLESRFADNASYEVRGIYLTLVMLAQKQRPVGTLPADHSDLAHKLRLPIKDWNRLCTQDFGPLYGWEKCLCDDGEVRLMHPVVLSLIETATKRRAKTDAASETQAIRQRRKRLRDGLLRVGCIPALVEDETLMTRMDGWLLQEGVTRRTDDHYRAALDHAVQQRWIDRGRA